MALIKAFPKKTPDTFRKMKRCISYALKKEKTREDLKYGFNCNVESAYMEMKINKQIHGKMDGEMYKHFTQSFPIDANISPEDVNRMGRELLERCEIFEGYQVVMATHIDKDHLHNHFILNTVNVDTGKKWHQSPNDLKNIKKESLQICKENDIEINFKKGTHSKKLEEIRAEQRSDSWKKELKNVITRAMEDSVDFEGFKEKLQNVNYDVRERGVFFTYTTPTNLYCRNDNLDPNSKYSREHANKVWEENAQKKSTIENKNNLVSSDHLVRYAHVQQEGWKEALKREVCSALNQSVSKEMFVRNMKDSGYDVKWGDNKYITFTTPSNKVCRNNKLEPAAFFSKENMTQFIKSNNKKQKNQDDGLHRLSPSLKQREKSEEIKKHKEDRTVNKSLKKYTNKEDRFKVSREFKENSNHKLSAILASMSDGAANQSNDGDDLSGRLRKATGLEGQARKEKAIELSDTDGEWSQR